MPQDLRRSPSRPLIATAVGAGLLIAGAAVFLLNRPPSQEVTGPSATAPKTTAPPASSASSAPSASGPRASAPGAPATGPKAPASGKNTPPATGLAGNPSAGLPAGSTRPPGENPNKAALPGNHVAAQGTYPKFEGELAPGTELPPADYTIYPDGITPPLDLPSEPEVPMTETAKVLAEVEARAKSDPNDAATWVESFAPGDLRDEAREFVVHQWEKKDPAAATAWRAKDVAAAQSQAATAAE